MACCSFVRSVVGVALWCGNVLISLENVVDSSHVMNKAKHVLHLNVVIPLGNMVSMYQIL